jgi:hypothetical protein
MEGLNGGAEAEDRPHFNDVKLTWSLRIASLRTICCGV